jgi:hypothetical protein
MVGIFPIDRIRREVLDAMHAGQDLETAVHQVALRFGLPAEAVHAALENEEVAE